MRRLTAAWAAAALVALGVVVTTAGPSSAQLSCQGTQTASPATVTPTTSVLPGESITLTGGGFAANQVLGIGLFRPPVVLGSVASNIHGNYSATIQLPLETPPGQNEITVFGVGPNSTCHQSLALFSVRELPVPVTSPPVTLIFPQPTIILTPTAAPVPIVVQQPLARTGSPSPALAAGALLAVVLGFHAVRVAGRRTIAG